MITRNLAIYLNDHLAGSETILELLAHLASDYPHTAVEPFSVELRAEVMADRKELEQLMARLHVEQSTSRKTAGRISEKFAQLKLHVDDLTAGPFRLFESLEAISIGVEGKRLLWRVLAAISADARNCERPITIA